MSSDRVTVIRKGQGIGTVVTNETNPEELATLMVGRQVTFKTEKGPCKSNRRSFTYRKSCS